MQRNRGKDEDGERIVDTKHETPAMTKELEQLAKTRKGIRSARRLGPDERLFGEKGMLVRYKPNLTDDSPEKSNHDPGLNERQSPDDTEILDDEVE